ncbi:hypothetical protein FOA52_004226 [Chlamydomonas sp. UWO 241]|nr:hypothetical protein FOA52_004226 [Chlamydomonas sp. UWO 241]
MTFCARCNAEVELMMDDSSGFSCCGQCGCVLEEHNFSSDLTFATGADGTGGMVGTIVGQTSGGRRGAYGGADMEGHESSAARGHQEMSAIADHFHLPYDILDASYRLYKLALQHGFTRGRRVNQVAATCLYITCRQEKKPYMLIDFSDNLSVNVYTLGAVYLQLLRLFRLEEYPAFTKPIDPSLFLHRFAERLNFGKKTREVQQTALHLVQSMKRDWMQTGRKPSGICGAALFIAAHIHGFERTKQDIIGVVHIGWSTIEKRVKEFANTSSSLLTHAEFTNMSGKLAQEHEAEAERMLALAVQAAADELVTAAAAAAAGPSTSGALLPGAADEDGVTVAAVAAAPTPTETQGARQCEHVAAGTPSLAHGMCRGCFEEYLCTSGGIYLGSSDPPAYMRNLRQEVRMSMKAISDKDMQPLAMLEAGAGMDAEAAELEAALQEDAMARLAEGLMATRKKGDAGGSGAGGSGAVPPAGAPRRTKAQLLEERQQRAAAAAGGGAGGAGPSGAGGAADGKAGPAAGEKRARAGDGAAEGAPAAGVAGVAAAEAASEKRVRAGDGAAEGAAAAAGVAAAGVDGGAAVEGGAAGGGAAVVAGVGVAEAVPEEDEDVLSDLSDEEQATYIATTEEAELKGLLWCEMNKDWLERQKQKERDAAAREANGEAPPEKRKRAAPKKKAPLNADNAKDAARNMLAEKKLSNKINYSVLADMFDAAPPGGPAAAGPSGTATGASGSGGGGGAGPSGAHAHAPPAGRGGGGGGGSNARAVHFAEDAPVNAALQLRAARRAADAEKAASNQRLGGVVTTSRLSRMDAVDEFPLSACGDDVKTATTFFNGTTSPPENKVQAFIRNASISDSCCAASKELNAARCNYEAPVQELAAALIGADVATYDRFASAVAQICGFVKIC